MKPDDEVCLCFHVSLRKIRTYMKREDPPVASLISECLGAGTGCRWCVPILKKLHAQHRAGETPELRVSAAQYASGRAHYRRTGDRPAPDAPVENRPVENRPEENGPDNGGPKNNGPDGDPSGPEAT